MREQGINAKKQIISIVILLALIIMTFSFYLRGYSFRELHNSIAKADHRYLLAGLSMMLLFIACEAVNIYLILKVLGHKTSIFRCFEYAGIGFYFSSITPTATGGQPAQIYYMKQDKIPISVSSVAIFYIIYVYQISMILMGILMSIFRVDAAIVYIHKLKYLFMLGFAVNAGAIFILFSLMFSKKLVPAIMSLVLKTGVKLKILRNGEALRSKFDKSLISYREKAMLLKAHPGLFFKVLFVTIIQMAALNLIPSLVYCSLGHETKNALSILTGQSLLTISVSAIPLPGAEGVAQGGFLRIFNGYFSENILAYAMLINRTMSFYIPLVFSFIMYLYTHIRTVKQSVRGDFLE